jgi:hypothetical protein
MKCELTAQCENEADRFTFPDRTFPALYGVWLLTITPTCEKCRREANIPEVKWGVKV